MAICCPSAATCSSDWPDNNSSSSIPASSRSPELTTLLNMMHDFNVLVTTLCRWPWRNLGPKDIWNASDTFSPAAYPCSDPTPLNNKSVTSFASSPNIWGATSFDCLRHDCWFRCRARSLGRLHPMPTPGPGTCVEDKQTRVSTVRQKLDDDLKRFILESW